MKSLRDLGPRVAIAAIAVPIVLAAVWWAPAWVVAGLAGSAAGVAGWELAALKGTKGAWRLGAAVAAAAVPILAWIAGGLPPAPSRATECAVALGVAGGVFLARPRSGAPGSNPGRVSTAAVLYCGVPLTCLAALREASPNWALLALAVSWGGDIAAYLVGGRFGRLRLAHRLSPRKTIEGAVASLACALALAVLLAPRLGGAAPGGVIAIALVGNVLGQAGDLFESSLKRASSAKDSGRLFLAHGGMLDVIDGLCFAAPWLYLSRGMLR